MIHHSTQISGAEKSLLDFFDYCVTEKCGVPYRFFVACPKNGSFTQSLIRYDFKIITLPFLTRLYRTINIFILIKQFIQIGYVSLLLYRVCKTFKINLIHANTTNAFLHSVFIAKYLRIPIVWHIRDQLKPSILKKFLEKQADRIICISKFIQKSLFYPDHPKVEQIYNGIQVKKLNYTIPFYFDYLLVVAQFVPWKRHDFVIEAFKMLQPIYPDLHVVFVGEDMFGEHALYVNSLKYRINLFQLNNKIHFVGYQENVYSWIKNCRLLIHPADNEPLGRVVIEAMMLGKIVIVSNNGGIVEYIQDKRNGFLFKSNSAYNLALQIQNAMKIRDYSKVIKHAQKTSILLFNIDSQSEKMLDVYNNILLKK